MVMAVMLDLMVSTFNSSITLYYKERAKIMLQFYI